MGDTYRGVSVRPCKSIVSDHHRCPQHTVASSYTAAAHSTTLSVQLG